jgi:hypothetical protein
VCLLFTAGSGHTMSSSDRNTLYQQGCLRLPKKLQNAAQAAGLGNEQGVYGHIRGLEGAVGNDPESARMETSADDVWEKSKTLTGDDRLYISAVERDIIEPGKLGVTFDDIAALDKAKQLLNEAVVLPLIMPEFFTGLREPVRTRCYDYAQIVVR